MIFLNVAVLCANALGALFLFTLSLLTTLRLATILEGGFGVKRLWSPALAAVFPVVMGRLAIESAQRLFRADPRAAAYGLDIAFGRVFTGAGITLIAGAVAAVLLVVVLSVIDAARIKRSQARWLKRDSKSVRRGQAVAVRLTTNEGDYK